MKATEGIIILVGVILSFFSLFSFLVLENEVFGFTSMFFLIISIPIIAFFMKGAESIQGAVSKGKSVFTLKSRFKKKDTAGDSKINELAKMSNQPLFSVTTVFPFDLFPDSILLDQKQVILVYRHFFYSSQEYNIAIEDILSPVVETSILFATFRLELGAGGFEQNPPPIHYLRKKSAIRLKRLIMGLIMCKKEDIDLSEMTRSELIAKLEDIGSFRQA